MLLFFDVKAQKSTIDTSLLNKIKKEAFSNSQSYKLLTTLCDEYGPRLTWSPAYKKAADFVVDKLNEWKMQNVHIENFDKIGKSWTIRNYFAQVTEPWFIPLIAYPKAWTPGTNSIIESDLVYLDAKSEKDFEKYQGKLKGKIVLIVDQVLLNPIHSGITFSRLSDSTLFEYENASAPDTATLSKQKNEKDKYLESLQFISKKVAFCKNEGASLLLDPSLSYYGIVKVMGVVTPVEPKTLNDFWYGLAYNPDIPETVPQMKVSLEQYNHLMRLLKKGKTVKIKANIDVVFDKPQNGFNVIAEIPGTDLKNEVVIIGAQLDTYQSSSGAVDNTVGIVTCMETLRILSNSGIKPRRTIRICLFGGGEEHQLGSYDYVKKHFEKYSPEKCYINFNNICAGRYRGIFSMENNDSKPVFKEWMSYINDPKFKTVSFLTSNQADNTPFDEAGLPGFGFIQDDLDFGNVNHSNMDVIERVQREDLKQNAFIMAALAYFASVRDGDFPGKTKK